jgi:hypothetical protein
MCRYYFYIISNYSFLQYSSISDMFLEKKKNLNVISHLSFFLAKQSKHCRFLAFLQIN